MSQLQITLPPGTRWSDLSMRERFAVAWEQLGYDGSDIEFEHRFHPIRKWRFDVAFPSRKVAIELDGVGFGHNSAAGRAQDNEKQNAAIELGWSVMRFGSSQLSKTRMPVVIEQVMRTLANEPDPEAHRRTA